MKSIEQSEIQLAALRASHFVSRKMQSVLPSTTEFCFFGFHKAIRDVACLNKKEFFIEIEDRSTQFFMQWFSDDSATDFSVRRRIALHGVNDAITEQFWKKVESAPELPRDLSVVETSLRKYEMEDKKRSSPRFSFPRSPQYYKEINFLRDAKLKGGVVSGEKSVVVDIVQRQLVIDLTTRFNQILNSVNAAEIPFVYSDPWLSTKPLEQRLIEKRGASSSVIDRPPARPPSQTSY